MLELMKTLQYSLFLFFFSSLNLLANEPSKVLLVDIQSTINTGTAEIFKNSLKQAESEKFAAVVYKLDTPGGFLEATRDIVKLLLNSKMPTVVWVMPQGAHAASAGSMITMAAHYAAMAPSTSIGAATPVTGGGKDVGKSMKNKITNDTLAFVEGIARKRGRNIEWAKESVTKAASLSSENALKENVIDGVHDTMGELWPAVSKKLKLSSSAYNLVEYKSSLSERFLNFVSNPNIAMGLMALGALGIYVEMTNPGLFIPGIVGAISLALGAITMKIIPIQPGAIVLLVIGIILLALEILTPIATFGVAGVAGLAAMFMSGLFLLDPKESMNVGLDPLFWIPAFLLLSAFMIFLGQQALKALRSPGIKQGIESLVGKEGIILSQLKNGDFKIKVQGEIWNAAWAEGQQEIKIDAKVVVVEQKGLKALVKLA